MYDRKNPKPLLQLRRDHETVLKECVLLTTIANQMERNAYVDEKLAHEAIYCIHRLSSLLTDHQSREEEILIPIVQERFDSEVSASVGKEHVQIMELLQRLEEKVTPHRRLNSHTVNSIRDPVEEFNSFLRAHIAREENVLFWFASLYITRSGTEDSELSLQNRQ